MSWLLFNHLANTTETLRNNKSRNFLTILGIAIGACCITMVLALTNGARELSSKDLSNYHPETILIRPTEAEQSIEQTLFNNHNFWTIAQGLPSSDLEILAKIPEVDKIAPILPFYAQLQSTHHELNNQMIIGSTPNLLQTTKIEIESGQFLTDDILPNSAIIGSELAQQLFDTKNAVGQTFKMRYETFVVVGVLKPQTIYSPVTALDYNQAVIINFATAQRLVSDANPIRQINFSLKPGKNTNQVLNNIRIQLTTNHQSEFNFQIIAPEPNKETLSKSYRDLSSTTLLVAIIALVIGGIGVMNIMLVNVAERTQEIGIRRAIGATEGNIIGQFLVESISLSALGGLFGIAAGFGLSILFRAVLPFPALFDWQLVVIVMIITVVVGLIAGVIPAIRASSKNPIDSLRQF